MVRVDAKRDCRKQQHLGASLVSFRASTVTNLFHLENVGTVRHVQIMRFGGPKRQHSDFPLVFTDVGMILFGQDPFG